MKKPYRASFKAQRGREIIKAEKTWRPIASEKWRHPQQLTAWQALAIKGRPSLFEPGRSRKAALFAEIGRLTHQLAWLKKKSGQLLEEHTQLSLGGRAGRRLASQGASGLADKPSVQLIR